MVDRLWSPSNSVRRASSAGSSIIGPPTCRCRASMRGWSDDGGVRGEREHHDNERRPERRRLSDAVRAPAAVSGSRASRRLRLRRRCRRAPGSRQRRRRRARDRLTRCHASSTLKMVGATTNPASAMPPSHSASASTYRYRTGTHPGIIMFARTPERGFGACRHCRCSTCPEKHRHAIAHRIDSMRRLKRAADIRRRAVLRRNRWRRCSSRRCATTPRIRSTRYADRLILSKGHAAPIFYAAWAEAGSDPEATNSSTFAKFDVRSRGSPDAATVVCRRRDRITRARACRWRRHRAQRAAHRIGRSHLRLDG